MRHASVLLTLAIAGWAFVVPDPAAAAVGEPATTAEEVTPLPVGSALPSLTLTGPDGSAFDLNAAVAEKPTVLILYRGGW